MFRAHAGQARLWSYRLRGLCSAVARVADSLQVIMDHTCSNGHQDGNRAEPWEREPQGTPL